jgi:hypothetical protein
MLGLKIKNDADIASTRTKEIELVIFLPFEAQALLNNI